jgi:uncharacterized phage protein (TIGR02218 family)
MSRTLNASLQARLDSGTTTLCHVVTITRTDGTILRLTDHDRDVVVSGDTYVRDNSVAVAAITSSANNGIQSTNCNVIFSDDAITEVDVARGVYDKAVLEFAVVDYEFPAYGKIILLTGLLSTITVNNRRAGQFEIKGLLTRGDTRIGEYYSAHCRADLGDSRCTVALAAFTTTGTVNVVETQGKIRVTFADNFDNGFFTHGVMTFSSGDNDGISMEVLNQFAFGGGQDSVFLALRMPYDIQVGDTFTIVAGCDKTKGTCRTKFDNIKNYRGEPFVPGPDFISDFIQTGVS